MAFFRQKKEEADRQKQEEAEQRVERQATTHLRIAWPIVVIILGILTITALGTLVTIVTIHDVDILSTVALALAVVSFAAQLIVTLAQAQQSARLTGETMAALSEMRATTASLLSNQSGQFDRLLDVVAARAATAAAEDVVGDQGGGEEGREEQVSIIEDALQSALNEAISQIRQEAAKRSQPPPPPPESSAARLRRVREMRARNATEWDLLMDSFPTRENGEEAAAELRKLPPRTVRALIELGRSLRDKPTDKLSGQRRRIYQIQDGPFNGPPAWASQLERAGFVKIDPLESNPDLSPTRRNAVMLSTTPKGINALRILNAVGDPPEWAAGIQ
ncbi:hypothetical protein O6P37_15935 [Mycobacterium sp. CPCC 205372]|uniref:Uncharacterized protein n=1 Tax=Mycobacterium hippophais TaxID=3016340 RepID=A0ABT4PUX9_9MYCO|nr:hypothetical protein [Mycobacterium hippophais]MCZ8380359.1 hypothetical protein [Mycobacterium hippophais]